MKTDTETVLDELALLGKPIHLTPPYHDGPRHALCGHVHSAECKKHPLPTATTCAVCLECSLTGACLFCEGRGE